VRSTEADRFQDRNRILVNQNNKSRVDFVCCMPRCKRLETITKRAAVRLSAIIVLICCAAIPVPPPVAADEGVWTFDNPPCRQLKERYDFTLTSEWLEHVRFASLRSNDGGSGSLISPTGLVLTNHHVALGQPQKASYPRKDYVQDGFYARTQAEEMKSPDLELNRLVSMENVAI